MIYTIETYNKACGTIDNVACPSCGRRSTYIKVQNKTKSTIMFIPWLCITNATFVVCGACQGSYKVKQKTFKNINDNLGVLDAIHEQHQCDLEKMQKLREKYSVGVSEIKQSEALLSCLGVQFGLPFFFLGRPILGVLAFVSSFALIIYDKLEFMGVLPMIGMLLALFIALGKVKDRKGKYILGKKQRKEFLGDESII